MDRERPEIVHTARDWPAKLHVVAAGCGLRAAGCGLTTVPAALAADAPPGVRVLPVRGGPQEQRRLLLARLLHPPSEPAGLVAAALRATALDLGAPAPPSP
ncbi:transcriptional regulator [Streptomyces sp. DSM 40868]|nr:transcriptional regulator [Streptomyces sp. DSM 40868]